MIDEKDAQIFKFHDDYARNKRKFIQYLKYAEIWQSMSVICSYAAFLCDIEGMQIQFKLYCFMYVLL